MKSYMLMVMWLNFLTDFLLLLGTDRLCGYLPRPGRAALAAMLGSVYGGACLLPGFRFLGNFLWRMVSLLLMAGIAFGLNGSTLRRTPVFILLAMALSGVAVGLGTGGFWTVVLSAMCICILCCMGFRGRNGGADYVPVELNYGEKSLQLTALQDTGNTLRDPITGSSVMVIGADAAQKLTGLTRKQLNSPLDSVGALPGLRLIPYRSVGMQNGLLLAMKLPQVKIGTWQGSGIVAFAPEGLSPEGSYQALIGGMV